MTDAPLIESLRNAACYPHAVDAIRIVETHISWIVLTGAIAYKIKKPVRFSFLDFSTLELRKYYCEEELRLNRRFAPELYLGLSTIRRDASGAISIDTEVHGPIAEYAVRLRQFDRTQELDGLVEGGTVDAELLREFGRKVADTHASAATAHEPHHGTPDAIRSIVAGNVEELGAADLPADESAIVNRVASRLEALGQALHETMLGRRERSCVRECHGDLHAGNVV
ncbi:MAG TPA: hypothetical protein VLT59_15080, partial [Steroidobacteraceae bacterium]|nr:hypothetical protein [Steroidobacteraceae bacterium]